MKKRITTFAILLLLSIGLSSCDKYGRSYFFHYRSNLYEITDEFIEEMYGGDVLRYSILDYDENVRHTVDGKYRICPVGRGIVIKITTSDETSESYTKLIKDLKWYYKDDTRVVDIYVNNLGTAYIDCRR